MVPRYWWLVRVISIESPRVKLTHWKVSASEGLPPARSLRTTLVGEADRDEFAVGGLEGHPAKLQPDHIKLGVGAFGGNVDQFVAIGRQEAAIGVAGQNDLLAGGDFAFAATGAGSSTTRLSKSA